MNASEAITRFLSGAPHAVVGASANREKTGNRVLRAYLEANRPVYAVNSRSKSIESMMTYPALAAIPTKVHGVSIATPPQVAKSIVEDAASLGIGHVWFQPGAETEEAVALALQRDMNVIHGGPCILMALEFAEGVTCSISRQGQSRNV